MAGLLTPLPLQFIRQYAGAVDQDVVFESTADRIAYLTVPRRYGGQIVFDLEIEQIFVLNAARNAWIPIQANTVRPIEVVVGTAAATDLNIVEGSTTVQNPKFIGRDVQVFRNDVIVHGFDYGDGMTYLTKDYESDTITFSDPLINTESLKIYIL
jgi:hypothetical protein